MAKPDVICKVCRFANFEDADANGGNGFCLRRAPIAHPMTRHRRHPITGKEEHNTGAWGGWPPVRPEHGCWDGEVDPAFKQ